MPIFVWPQLMRCAEYQFYLICVCAVLGRMKNHFNQLDLCSILLSHCLLITFLSALWIFMCECTYILQHYQYLWLRVILFITGCTELNGPYMNHFYYTECPKERKREETSYTVHRKDSWEVQTHSRRKRSLLFHGCQKKRFLNGPLFHHFGSFCWFSWVHALNQQDTKNHVLYPVHYTMLPSTIASFRRIEVICDKIIITQWLCWAAYGKLVELSGSELMMVFDVHRRWAAPCWSIKCVHKAFGNKLNILI